MAVVLPFCHFLSMANGQWPRLVQNSRTQCSMGRQCREQHLQHSTAYGFNHLFLAAAKMPRKSKGKKKKKKSVRRQHNKGEVSSCQKYELFDSNPKQGAEISSDVRFALYEQGGNI